MKITVYDINKIINDIPVKERVRWQGVQIIISKDAVFIDPSGSYVSATWSMGVITIYSEFINDYKHLKKVLLHELGHHLGLDEKNIPSEFK